MRSDCTAGEIMVAAASREIRNGDVVFVGMRLPLIAFQLAKLTHAPDAVGVFENGIVRVEPTHEPLYTMSDPPNVVNASMCTRLLVVMGMLGRGRVDVGFIGGAEVDRFGNINSSRIGPRQRPRVKLPGSGGACDIASLSQRLVILLPHEPRRLREAVDFVTSPGYLRGLHERRDLGLPGGPHALITTLAVFRFDPQTGEAYVSSVHPGHTVEEVQARTGWEVRVAKDVIETPPPTPEELELIRRLDPEGLWTRRSP